MGLFRTVLAGLWLALGLTACATAPPEPAVGSRDYFRALDASLVNAGNLRTDRLARNVPFTNQALIDHFRRTAFGSEFADAAAPATSDDVRLKRWVKPIRYRLFGRPTRSDRDAVRRFAARLSRLTGIDIFEAPPTATPALWIHFLDQTDRREMRAKFANLARPNPNAPFFNTWSNRPHWPCAGEIAYRPLGDADQFQIELAVIYIRDEVEGISRLACIEEEMSQVMGLARDDRAVRPSIFNDDEEFALLTHHDEYLLRMLYDPRLAPGMTPARAMPIVRRIVRDLRP